MPVNIKYTRGIHSPLYKPGSDIILGSINSTPIELQSLSDNISFSDIRFSFLKKTKKVKHMCGVIIFHLVTYDFLFLKNTKKVKHLGETIIFHLVTSDFLFLKRQRR